MPPHTAGDPTGDDTQDHGPSAARTVALSLQCSLRKQWHLTSPRTHQTHTTSTPSGQLGKLRLREALRWGRGEWERLRVKAFFPPFHPRAQQAGWCPLPEDQASHWHRAPECGGSQGPFLSVPCPLVQLIPLGSGKGETVLLAVVTSCRHGSPAQWAGHRGPDGAAATNHRGGPGRWGELEAWRGGASS